MQAHISGHYVVGAFNKQKVISFSPKMIFRPNYTNVKYLCIFTDGDTLHWAVQIQGEDRVGNNITFSAVCKGIVDHLDVLQQPIVRKHCRVYLFS